MEEKNSIEKNNPAEDRLRALAIKKRTIIFTVLWLIGMLLLFISLTDLFTQSPFQKKYTAIYFLMVGSTFFVALLWRFRMKQHAAGKKKP